MSKFQMSGNKSETLDRPFKLSADELDIWPRVLVWILVLKSSAEVLEIRFQTGCSSQPRNNVALSTFLELI